MIHYYFGDKNGLLFAVMARHTDEILLKLRTLDRIDPAAPPTTREIFKLFIDAFYAKPWIMRMSVSEFCREGSAIKQFFTRKYGPQGQTLAILRRAFKRLIDAGLYDRNVNPSHAALSMLSIILGPFLFGPMLWGGEAKLDQFTDEGWVDYVGDLFAHRYPELGRAEPGAPPLRPASQAARTRLV